MPWLLFLLLNMPRELETYTASGNLRQGPVAAGTPASALTQPWDALGDVGKSIQFTAAQASQIGEQRQKENDIKWSSDAESNYKDTLIKWQTDPANQGREDIGEAYRKFADEQLAEMLKSAPNAKAGEVFKRNVAATVRNDWANNLERGENLRQQNFAVAQVNRATVANESYRYRVADFQDGAGELREQEMIQQIAQINHAYGKVAPTLAMKLSERAVRDAVDGVMKTDPELAKKMLDNPAVDPSTRETTLARIEASGAAQRQLDTWRFTTAISDSLDAGMKRMEPVPELPRSAFDFTGDNAQLIYEKYERARKSTNETIEQMKSIHKMNGYEQDKALAGMDLSDDPAKREAGDKLRTAVKAAQEQQVKAPVEWVMQNNPDVRLAFDTTADLPPEMQADARKWSYRMLMQYQGHAPANASNPERYLGHDRVHVLSPKDATRRVTEINAASIDKKKTLLTDLQAEFGGDAELANRAYADMLELSTEKLSASFRFAGIINDQNTQTEFIGAQTNPKALDGLDENKKSEYLNALDSNPNWRKFGQAWMGEKMEGAGDVHDAKASLMTYANSLAVKHGMKEKAAMDTAVDRVISKNYGFANVWGHQIAIGRKRLNGGPDRTDAEIEDIGRKLKLSLRDIDPRKIALNNPIDGAAYFPGLPPGGDMSKPEVAQSLRDIITSNGFYIMEPHGESVKLFINEPGRAGFMALDKTNRPLEIKLDDLPDFDVRAAGPGAFTKQSMPVSALPQTYPLVTQKTTGILGTFKSSISTNWPTLGNYFITGKPRTFAVE
jgi:hypothetical protein